MYKKKTKDKREKIKAESRKSKAERGKTKDKSVVGELWLIVGKLFCCV